MLHASTDHDLDTAFATLVRLQAGGLLVISSDSFLFARSEQLAALAVRHAVPAIFGFREFAAAGGPYDGCLHWPHSQGREACRPSGPAGMNGGRLAEELKARQPEVRALFMTGYSRDTISDQWPVDTNIEMLHKPLTQDALEQKVRAILNQAR